MSGFVFKSHGKQEVEGLRMGISFGRVWECFLWILEGRAGKNQEIEMSRGVEGGFG